MSGLADNVVLFRQGLTIRVSRDPFWFAYLSGPDPRSDNRLTLRPIAGEVPVAAGPVWQLAAQMQRLVPSEALWIECVFESRGDHSVIWEGFPSLFDLRYPARV